MDMKELLLKLTDTMSIAGFEYYDEDKLTEILSPYFDGHDYDSVGNHIFIRRCGKENAKKLMIDVHYDEVGLMVKNITKDGYLRVCSMGGTDARVYPASEVVVYGKEKMAGIVLTKPVELMTPDESGKLVATGDLLIDIGLTKEEAEEMAPIGTPIGYAYEPTELLGDLISIKGLDDKCSAVPVVDAISKLDMASLNCDIYFSFSAKEEVGHRAVASAAYRIEPDMAIVIDVTFGAVPGGDKSVEMELGKGLTLALTAHLDSSLADEMMNVAKKNEISLRPVVDGAGTGTHADILANCASGVPTVLISLPVWFMHAPIETLSMKDLESMSALLQAFITEKFSA